MWIKHVLVAGCKKNLTAAPLDCQMNNSKENENTVKTEKDKLDKNSLFLHFQGYKDGRGTVVTSSPLEMCNAGTAHSLCVDDGVGGETHRRPRA